MYRRCNKVPISLFIDLVVLAMRVILIQKGAFQFRMTNLSGTSIRIVQGDFHGLFSPMPHASNRLPALKPWETIDLANELDYNHFKGLPSVLSVLKKCERIH
jgi:hypothetical protein